MATVDVVIPCYNYGKYLRRSVESVVSQAGVDTRVLIIDDNSPDDTYEIASELSSKYNNVLHTRHSSNIGHIRTYNEGLDWAEADYTLLLSADDFLMPDSLALSTAVMDANPEVGFTFGRAHRWDDERIEEAGEHFPRTPSKTQILHGHAFIRLAAARNIVPTPTAVVRTKLQKLLGGYKQELPHSGDMEMWLRFAAHGSVGILNEYQAIYRQHKTNMSKSYQVHGWLPDLIQREAALRYFFKENSHLMGVPVFTHKKSIYMLAKEAFNYASAALNLNESEACKDLERYGLSISPVSRLSKSWVKLNLKKCLQIFPRSPRRPNAQLD